MDKKTLDYLSKGINTSEIQSPIFSREVTEKGMEHITVTLKEVGVIYRFWNNPFKKIRTKGKPKHSGGKRPYVMISVEEVKALRKKLKCDKVKNAEEAIGFVVLLVDHIEWNTGKLIDCRSKKALRYVDLKEMFGHTNNKLDKILSVLRKYEILINTKEGYFVSTKLFRKGKTNLGGR